MATIRREVRIPHPADEVWNVVGDPGTIHEWFPGIVSSTVEETEDGTMRHVVLGSGIPLVEHVVTNDPITKRFQYRITGGAFREHLGTIDVIDLGDGTCLAVYGTDATPDVMALVIGGASGAALEGLRDLVAARAATSEGTTP
ncbi:MAG: SRPBCC family protein [Microthrixaceae bacterium]